MIEELTCDRCGEVFTTGGETTIDELKWMKKYNGSGSMLSNMALMLCASCTEGFFLFMFPIRRNGKVID
jgi:hypothetical protein